MDFMDFINDCRSREEQAIKEQQESELIDQQIKTANNKLSPSDFINSIQSKNRIMSEKNRKQYNSFQVVRGLSMVNFNVGHCYNATMLSNKLSGLPKEFINEVHYEYLMLNIRKGVVRTKWAKLENYKHLDLIMNTFNVNRFDGIELLDELNDDALKRIIQWSKDREGGVKGRPKKIKKG